MSGDDMTTYGMPRAGLMIAAGTVLLFSWINVQGDGLPLNARAAQPGTPPPVGAAEATVAAEMTAIARFTLEPEIVISYTPYFAEIIARDLARRNLTSTAAATLMPITRYTHTPTPTPSGTPICSPALTVRILDEESMAVNTHLIARELEANAEVQVSYVDYVDGTCDAAALPIHTLIAVNVTVALPIPLSREQSGELLAPILAAVADYDLPANLRERPVQLRIYLVHEDR